MTEAVQVAMITGFVTVISVSLNTWIQSKNISTVKSQLNDKLDLQTQQATVVERKVDDVHNVSQKVETLVNSKSDKQENKVSELTTQVTQLTKLLQKNGVK